MDYTNIELIFPHDLFLKAEEIYESKGVTEINNPDKNLFSFVVKEGKKYEVEWHKPLTKNQRSTCECAFFKSGNMCKHAIAALIAYKEEIFVPRFDAKQEVKEREIEAAQSKGSVLNINAILSNLSKEELRTFIKAYASHDKKFATAIKVHFARKVDLADNEKKYKSILDSIVRAVTSGKAEIKASEIRGILNITEEFLSQADDALASALWREAFILIKVTLNKLCYICHYAAIMRDDLIKNIYSAHNSLSQLLINMEKNEALATEIHTYLLELATTSYYPFLNCTINVVDILMSKYPESMLHYRDLVDQLILKCNMEDLELVVLLAIRLRLACNLKEDYKLHFSYSYLADKIGDELLKEMCYQDLCHFAQNNKGLGKNLALMHLKALFQLKSKALILESFSYIKANSNIKIVEFIKSETDGKTWDQLKIKLHKDLPFFKKQPIFYMHLLHKMEEYDLLFDYLREKQDVKSIQTFDEYLYQYNSEALATLYETLVENYLNTYIGTNSAQYIKEIMDHLRKIKAIKVINKLGLLIDLKFSHRLSLEEIKTN